MTSQEMLDKVWDWFIAKKNPPGWNGTTCEYSTMVNGKERRCAVGCLLPPRDKAPWVDDLAGSVDSILDDDEHGSRVSAALFGESMQYDESSRDGRTHVLSSMQGFHDCAASRLGFRTLDEESLSQFRKELAEGLWTIAKAEKLILPTIGGFVDDNGKFTPTPAAEAA